MSPKSPFHLALLAAISVTSCIQEGGLVKDTGADCDGPSATVGADQSVVLGDRVKLEGAGTVCEGEPTLTWSLTAPPDSSLDNSALKTEDPAAPTFEPDRPGTYIVTLVVTDEAGASSPEAHVVIDVASDDAKPIADCGGNHTAKVDERVNLDGSGSSDPEGAVITYDWTLASKPTCSSLGATDIFDGTTDKPSVVPDCSGTFVVSLVVSDSVNFSDPAFCTVTAGTNDEPPVADAGDSALLSPCVNANFQLNGYGSYDPEGASLSYAWSVVSVPTDSLATIDNFNKTDVASPYFKWDVPGDYTFQLQVHDGTQASAPDIVTYTFQDQSYNEPPIANAGDDQSITVETECTNSSYTWTCEDCPAKDVTLDGTASDDPVDGDELDFLWTEVTTTELSIQAPYSPKTTATTPSFSSTYNSAVTKTWEVDLTVNDCLDDDSDRVSITYSCTGTQP